MYGASGKMGRGGGGKRNIHAPPIGRSAPSGRLSMGGGPRGRGGPSSAAAPSPSTSSLQLEESFSLVRENPLNFGMAIKLAPDLVEEIKRVEAQGGIARIKFGANTTGNVIHVGDKTFKFTWSREPGDLCDVYEERRSGDGGDGLLVESGGTWRKLNVERELDESTKNHVKRRSEEAERKMKSRKAIVLEHQNPSMKNQMKAFAASGSNQWRSNKNRKEPPLKKPKSELTSAGGPPKSVFKPGLPITSLSKGRLSTGSPLCSRPEQLGPSTSPVGISDLVKGHPVVSEVAATQNQNKMLSSEKDIANRRNSTINEKSRYNRNTEAKPADLKSLILSLLLEHQSTGMSMKALEKAIGDVMPYSARAIEPILKQIANYQTPGRYFLKPGMEMESSKKLPQSGSSPEVNHDQSPPPQKFDQLPAPDPSICTSTDANNEEQGELHLTPAHTADIIEKIDTQNSPENLSDKNYSNNCEGVAGSSSESGSDSDSDSDSSDSDSDSGSPRKSKSRSPVGSRSSGSSDSETDASSNSKQASDEDVDIMTSDDEKGSKHKLQDPESAAPRIPVPWSNIDNECVDIGNSENQDPFSDMIDIEKDSPECDNGAQMLAANNLSASKEGEGPTEETNPSSPDHYEQQDRQVSERKGCDRSEIMMNDGFMHSQSGSKEKSSKGNSKRRIDDKNSDERAPSKKRSKSKNSIEPVSETVKTIFGDSPNDTSPDRPVQVPEKRPVYLMEDRTTRNDTNYPDLQTGSNHQAISYRPVSDSQQAAQRSSEARGLAETPFGEKRSGKHSSLDLGVKYAESNLQSIEGHRIQKGVTTEVQAEDGLVHERRHWKFSSEREGDKCAPIIEPHIRKSEMTAKVKETVPSSNSYWGCSPKDKNLKTADRSPLLNGRNGVLRREHSDLELGEFREPFHEEAPASNKHFERKNSFKHLENKEMDADYWNSDFNGAKTSNKIPEDIGKMSSPNSDAAIFSNPDGPYRRKAQENHVDITGPHHTSTRPFDPHHQPRGELSSHQITVPEVSGKTRFSETGMGRAASREAYGDTSRKIPANSTEQKHDPLRGVGAEPCATKQSKKQKHNRTVVSNDRRRDALTGSTDSHQKNNLSISDETICSFTKFEKEEPELKVPIRDFSQYKEYVEEYQEKYKSYCSLNKILELYRDEFSKLGKDLEAYKGRDLKKYNDIVEQMRSSFRECGEKYKRMKKIFVVLYEELKHLKQMIKDYVASNKKD